MANTVKTSPSKERVFVLIALAALLSLSLSFYYFIYTPQQLSFYNKSCFRVLEEIVGNFKTRLDGYSKIDNKPKKINNNRISGNNFISKLQSQVSGKPPNQKIIDTINTSSWLDELIQSEKPNSSQNLEKIFEPIIANHRSTFESVILIKIQQDVVNKGLIVYNSSMLAIDRNINIDTLYKKNFTSPIILDLQIESVDYKLLLYPFRINKSPFVMGAFINKHIYKENAKTFPVFPLLILTIVGLILLMSLPYLKIFYISPQESIKAADIRSIISMTYVLPFFFTIMSFTIWFNYFINEKSSTTLGKLHQLVSAGFYNEIDTCIAQLKWYDAHIQQTDSADNALLLKTNTTNNPNPDIYLHPAYYKNMDAVFWVDSSGDEMAKWEFRRSNPIFFHKKDRQYFIDLKNNAGYQLPDAAYNDSFSLEPVLSKTTGDYTNNIAIPSYASIGGKKALVIGLSAKMYAAFNPVLPSGSDFCIINASGDILYHSQSERNLQENLFREVDNSDVLQLAVTHKDSVLIDDIKLYDKKVKMIVSPLNGLPYFMVSYIDKRPDLLYIFHISGFSIFCEGLLLLTIALLMLYFSYSNRHSSILFFSNHHLDFIKPSALKETYYKKILDYLLYILLFVILASFLFQGKLWMFFVLNISLLLPFFSVIGYYLIRYIENNEQLPAKAKESTKEKMHRVKSFFLQPLFRNNIINLLVPYALIITLYHLIKGASFKQGEITDSWKVNIVLVFLEIGVPLFAIIISLIKLPSIAGLFGGKGSSGKNAFLSYFVASIILSATVTSVVPTIGFMLNAAGQEKRLKLKAQQINLAENIQQHRERINKKVLETKLADSPASVYYATDLAYIDSLKFSPAKGLYLLNSCISTEKIWTRNSQAVQKDSSFYKMITRFLFLPPDHSDFFDNTKDYYYWSDNFSDSAKPDTIRLHYKNSVDHLNPSNLVISTQITSLFSPFRFFKYRLSLLLVICSILFIIILYRILSEVSKRIFLIGYFENSPGSDQDVKYLNNNFFAGMAITGEFESSFWDSHRITSDLIAALENEWPKGSRENEECVIKIVSLLSKTYEQIWQSLNPNEQFVLYDFAVDGFTNYKNVDVWYSLYKKGLVVKTDYQFKILNDSFRNFIVSKTGTREVAVLKRQISERGIWGNLRTVFYALLLIVIVFLFIVQEDVSKRVFAIVTSLGALIPFIIKLFDSGGSASNNEAKK